MFGFGQLVYDKDKDVFEVTDDVWDLDFYEGCNWKELGPKPPMVLSKDAPHLSLNGVGYKRNSGIGYAIFDPHEKNRKKKIKLGREYLDKGLIKSGSTNFAYYYGHYAYSDLSMDNNKLEKIPMHINNHLNEMVGYFSGWFYKKTVPANLMCKINELIELTRKEGEDKFFSENFPELFKLGPHYLGK